MKHRTSRWRVFRAVLGGVLAGGALAVVLGAGAPALAHNQLTGSDPADGETVAQGPAEVRLTFLASLDPDAAELTVTGPDGASAVTGDPDFDGSSVTIPVGTALAGEYVVDYDVLSNDGHWADGTIRFTVTEGETEGEEAEQTASVETPSPSPTPSPDAAAASPVPVAGVDAGEGGSGLAWWVWLLIAVVLAAGGGYGVYRRRRSAG